MPVHVKEAKSKALSTIDAALTILEKLPVLDETNSKISFENKSNPIQFITDLFKTTAGYDFLIKTISKFISTQIPILEIGIKSVLISNMKNLLSCSLNFKIPDEVLKNGVAFNVKDVDILEIMRYSPLDVNSDFASSTTKVGKYFYFDCDNARIPDDLLKSKDLNAFLWYVVHKANKREVWGKKKERFDNTDNNINSKDIKQNGVITLEYHERGESMTDANGNSNRIHTQTPLYNCVHAFIGNTEPFNIPDIANLLGNISKNSKVIFNDNYEINAQISEKDKLLSEKFNKDKLYKDGKITDEDYRSYNINYNNKLDIIERAIDNYNKEIVTLQSKITEDRLLIKNQQFNYKDYTKNYYYGKTIIEFNYDYIMSINIFDSKTLASQLIDSITGCISMDLNLSYEQLIVKNEVKKIINAIINTDYASVSDCFFSFSNDEYNEMLNKTELQRNGMLSINGEVNGDVNVNAEKLLEGLNNISKDSTKEEIQTIIEGTLIDISKSLSDITYNQKNNVNFGIQMNIIENLLNELAYSITINILTPKIYMLLLFNLKLMENKTDFDIRGFIEMFKQFIVSIIREVRDLILKYLIDELMKIVESIAKEIAVKLTIEQADYYYNLIRRLTSCIKKNNAILDFNIDNVDYADIFESKEIEPENNIC